MSPARVEKTESARPVGRVLCVITDYKLLWWGSLRSEVTGTATFVQLFDTLSNDVLRRQQGATIKSDQE